MIMKNDLDTVTKTIANTDTMSLSDQSRLFVCMFAYTM